MQRPNANDLEEESTAATSSMNSDSLESNVFTNVNTESEEFLIPPLFLTSAIIGGEFEMFNNQLTTLGSLSNISSLPPPTQLPVAPYESQEELNDNVVDHEDLEDETTTNPLAPMMTEVTAEQYQSGMDPQGINFSELPLNRQQYREGRNKRYVNYRNLRELDDIEGETAPRMHSMGDGKFFSFSYSRLTEKCAVSHFQLKHLLSSISKNDIFYAQHAKIKHWNPVTCTSSTFFDLSRIRQSIAGYFHQITSISAGENLVAAGGILGEVAWRRCDNPEEFQLLCDRNSTTVDITNYLEISKTRSGRTCIITSSNDCIVRSINPETSRSDSSVTIPWAPNCARLSPDKRILGVVGDSTQGLLFDYHSEEVISILSGHADYSFGFCWSPCGKFCVTGNQDKKANVYDLRNLKYPLTKLYGLIGAIRNLQYTSDGCFLAMAEPDDFVHIFDVNSGYKSSQIIDTFGEIGGISFTPDGDAFYIANAYDILYTNSFHVRDKVYGALLEYSRKRYHKTTSL